MIGILNAYHFDTSPGNYQEKYLPMIEIFLKNAFPSELIKNYHVAQGDFPVNVEECSLWIVTGSACSCYEEIPWINKLIQFIQEIDRLKVKTIGICFGHQLIAHALGGKVEKSDKGWGIGIRTFEILEYENYMSPMLEGNKCSLLFSHQDHVVILPTRAKRIATDLFCENQIYSIEKHIFCLQGHPEFSRDFARERYLARKEIIGEGLVESAIETLSNSSNENEIAQWFYRFLNA